MSTSSSSSYSSSDESDDSKFISAGDWDEHSSWVEHFEQFCASDELSLKRMKRMTSEIFVHHVMSDFEFSPFFFLVCMNKNVTVKIIRHLLNKFRYIDGGIGLVNVCMDMEMIDERLEMDSAYPIHLACLNEDCPGDVIILLMEKGDTYALTHLCFKGEESFKYFNDVGGTPLHFYLGRKTNVEVDVVKKFLSLDPNALSMADDETRCTPMHTLMGNENLGTMRDVLQYLVETNPTSCRLTDTYNQLPLHVACGSKTVTSEIVSLLLNVWPESIRVTDEMGNLALHHFCRRTTSTELDDEESLKILKQLIYAFPNSVFQKEDGEDALPIHIAAGAKRGAEFCKTLITAYPESVQVASLPLHHACGGGLPETVEYLLSIYPESINMRDEQGFLPIHSATCCASECAHFVFGPLLV